MKRAMMDGNGAATEAMRLAKVQVVSAYPITPQSPIAEKLASYIADGSLKAKYIRVESEHSAMACAIGAQLTGIRAGTATSSVGLALMHEVLGVAAGCRVPLVMPVVNRALVSPWSLWCDHGDSMSERDIGWMQFYVENAQEVLDLILISYRIAEDKRIQLPTMVCLDGFFLSHMSDVVLVPDQDLVDSFLPSYQSRNLILDPDNPMFINDLTPPSDFTEMRRQQQYSFDEALGVIPEVFDEFASIFGRKYQLLESYFCDDAEAVLVTLGSMSGTVKFVVDKLRSEGKKVGLVKIIAFRPFPSKMLVDTLLKIPAIGVIDRSTSLGAETGPLCSEVKAALTNNSKVKSIKGFIAGLGGRDITPVDIENAFEMLLAENHSTETNWLDVREDFLNIREVQADARYSDQI